MERVSIRKVQLFCDLSYQKSSVTDRRPDIPSNIVPQAVVLLSSETFEGLKNCQKQFREKETVF